MHDTPAGNRQRNQATAAVPQGRQRFTFLLPILVFGACLITLLWAAVRHQDQWFHIVREQGDRRELINYARLLEAHTRSVIRGLDQVVTHLKAVYEEDPASFDLARQVAVSPILRGLSVQVGIIDAEGYIKATTAPVAGGGGRIYLGDREHYKVHTNGDSGELFISKPVLGRASGKWSVQLTRRLNGANGVFAGVMVVSLSPDYITDIYQQIELGSDSTILVLGRDGIVRARASGSDRSVGQSLAGAPFLAELWDKPEGFIRDATGGDGQVRIGAFRRLKDYPLVVVVNQAEQVLTAESGRQHRVFVAAGWGGTLVVLTGVLLLTWLAARRLAVERHLRQRERELETARARLVARNQDLEQFARVLAHHLQEPVRLQHAYAQRLERVATGGGAAPPEALRALGFVLEGAGRLRTLLRDIQHYLEIPLDDASLADGSARPPVVARADRVLERLVAQFADRLNASGGAITFDALPGVAMPGVAIAEYQLAEVFQILITNALEYRRADVAPLIRVEARPWPAEDGKAWVMLAIVDNGIGIAPEYRERVFGIFERLHPRGEHPGNGIGLALARRIVGAVGGRIWIEDSPLGGISCCFILPEAPDQESGRPGAEPAQEQ